jgi:hypothetical protein
MDEPEPELEENLGTTRRRSTQDVKTPKKSSSPRTSSKKVMPKQKVKKVLELNRIKQITTKKCQNRFSMGSDCTGYSSEYLAVEQMGLSNRIDHKFACDKDPAVRAVLEMNFDIERVYKDVTTRKLEDTPFVNYYVNTSPCENFSIQGLEAAYSVPAIHATQNYHKRASTGCTCYAFITTPCLRCSAT